MSYLFVSRLYDSCFATFHTTRESLQREIALIEKEHQYADPGFKLDFIDPKALNDECGLAAYPHGTAIVVRFDSAFMGGKSTERPTIGWPRTGIPHIHASMPEFELKLDKKSIAAPLIYEVEKSVEEETAQDGDDTYISPFSGEEL